jgi:hypothetical protein
MIFGIRGDCPDKTGLVFDLSPSRRQDVAHGNHETLGLPKRCKKSIKSITPTLPSPKL